MRIAYVTVTALLSISAFFYPVAAHGQSTEQSKSDWEVGVTAYLWASGMNGDIGAIEGVQPIRVDMSFGDIFNHLKFAGMASVQASHVPFVMVGDLQFVSLGGSKNLKIRDVDLVDGNFEAQTFIASAVAGYRVADNTPITLDLMAGGRINSVRAKIALEGPLRSVEGSDTKTWIDPIIGAHASFPLSHRASFGLYGDVGGFGVSSDLTWQLIGALQYDLSEHWRASAGWRHYAVDYHKGAFLYDVSLSGPILGVRYRF